MNASSQRHSALFLEYYAQTTHEGEKEFGAVMFLRSSLGSGRTVMRRITQQLYYLYLLRNRDLSQLMNNPYGDVSWYTSVEKAALPFFASGGFQMLQIGVEKL